MLKDDLGTCRATNPVPCTNKATGTWASTPVCDSHFYMALAIMNKANEEKRNA